MDLKSFAVAISQISEERGIPREKVIETIEQALASAYKKDYGKKGQTLKAKLNPDTGELKFWQIKLVVDESMIYSEEELEKMKTIGRPEFAEKDDLEGQGPRKIRFNPERHLMIDEAKKVKKDVKPEEELEFPLEDKAAASFGRIAAQTAKQVVLQKIKEIEKDTIFLEFQEKEGQAISGVVQRIEGRSIFLNIGKTLGILTKEEQVPGEFYRLGQRLKVYLLKTENTPRGPVIFLSRSHPKLISRLFELEVPEIASGQVEIKSIAREPGSRSKIAVFSNDEKIDPIGACFPGRSLVLMEDFTFKPIAQLSEGEVVFTHSGQKRKIKKKYKRIWNGTLLKFKVFGVHKPIEVTKEHPLLFTSSYESRTEFREASQIKKGFLAIPIFREIVSDKTIYHFEKEKDFLWVLGIYLAEGSLDKAEVNFTLSQTETDKALKIQKIMKQYGGKVYIKARKPNRGKSLDATLFGYDWVEIFEDLGSRKAKKLTPRLMFLEPELQLEIFKGWIDGDGHFDQKRNKTVGVTTSEELLWQMYYILLRNRIRGNLQKRKKGKKMKKDAYQLEVAHNKTKDYRGFFRENYYFSWIRSVERVPSSPGRRVYNLEVEKNNSYIVHSIAVHNCVGQRGTRVIAVINELGGEKIDIIHWSEDFQELIANALSPAKVSDIKIKEKNTAIAIVPEDQLSLAIGKNGQNVRLAAKLTGWKIDIRNEADLEKDEPEESQAGEETQKPEEEKTKAKKTAAKKKAVRKTKEPKIKK